MKKHLLLATFLLPVSGIAQPQLVNDILPGVFSSNPSRLTVYNNQLHFFATDGVNGYELWKYDGTNANMVQDIFPGGTDCAPNSPNGRMAVTGNKIYFPADNGTTGLELCSYGGSGSTQLESDIAGGQNSSQIDEVIAINAKLYFDASNGTNGKELWEYDLIAKKTEQLTFINAGVGSDPDWITEANGKVYFTAESAAEGRELYEYNPATAELKLLADIYPGTTGSHPASLINVFGTLYFSASSPDYGRELYKYDGNAVQRLTDLNPNMADGLVVHGRYHTIGVAGDELFFAGQSAATNGAQLFKYNYKNNQVQAQPVVINSTGSSTPAGFIYYANKMFFTADDGTHGRELWTIYTNGNATMLADINTSPAVNIEPSGMLVYNGSLYFSAYGDKGNELYKYTDPAAAIADINTTVDVQVFPNPAATTVFFKLKLDKQQDLNMAITDASGRVVYSTKDTYAAGERTIPVPLNILSQGLYFYCFLNADGQLCASGRVVKM